MAVSVFLRFGSEGRRCRWVGRGHVSIVFGRWQWRTGRQDIKDAVFEWVESMARGSFRFSRFGSLRTTSIKVVSVVLSSLETHSKFVAVRLLSVFDLSLAADGVSFGGSFFRCSKVSSSFPSHPNVERRSPCVLLFSLNFEQVLLVLRVA